MRNIALYSVHIFVQLYFFFSDYRLIKLAQILDVIFEPESGELYRPPSNDSLYSASSSLTNTGSFLNTFSKPSANGILAKIPGEDTPDETSNIQLTQLKIDFKIDTVNFKMSQLCKNSNEDEEIFNFILTDLDSKLTVRTFDLTGEFNLGKLIMNLSDSLTNLYFRIYEFTQKISKAKLLLEATFFVIIFI